MLDMRRSEEAEGERRMMGSGRRAGFWLMARAGLFVIAVGPGFLDMKACASLRTWEKSWLKKSELVVLRLRITGHFDRELQVLTVGLIPLSTLFLSPMRRSPL